MATKDTVVQELVVNTLTQAQFDAAKEAGTLSPYELYGTPDTSVRLPVLTPMWFDHIANDVSWLRADTFSWHSGDVYKAAYEHLADEHKGLSVVASGDILGEEKTYYRDSSKDTVSNTNFLPLYAWVANDGTITYTRELAPSVGSNALSATGSPTGTITESTAKSDTIGDITITYYLADDGHKICLPDQEAALMSLYGKSGAADYYLLDTTNKRFKLPRKQKRTLIQAVKNTDGTWYNLYSDGWVEQGGRGKTNVSVTLPVAMTDSNYVVLVENHSRVNGGTGASDMTTTSFIPRWQQYNASAWGVGNYAVSWQVSGYAAESAYASAGMRLEYYYVGNFEQSAIEQTAGLNAELFNGKADVSRVETLEGYDYVVESQLPTADNGYTWYRKYKSGWVEQGGRLTGTKSSGFNTVTLPVEMQDNNYTASATNISSYAEGSGSSHAYVMAKAGVVNSLATTSFGIFSQNSGEKYSWQVSGTSAQ